MPSTMTRPDFSVVIPTRDRWRVLPRAVGTALAQSGVTLEVLVVDDWSRQPAPPLPILSDPRVKLLHNGPAEGVAAARNLGARHSTGEWLAFLDDDDVWAPHKLASLRVAANQVGARFAYSSALMIDADLTPLFVLPGPPAASLLQHLLERNAIPAGSSNVVVERAVFGQVDGFDESLSVLADWDAWLRLAQVAPAALVGDALTAYSVHPGNWVLRDDPADEDDYGRFCEKHAELIRRHGVAPNRLRYDRYIADSHLRAGHHREAGRRHLAAGLRERNLPTITRGLLILVAPWVIALRRLYRRRRGRPDAPPWLSAHDPLPRAA
jgi:glycosyltransferase involved in cell wall biosynthesis